MSETAKVTFLVLRLLFITVQKVKFVCHFNNRYNAVVDENICAFRESSDQPGYMFYQSNPFAHIESLMMHLPMLI